MYEDVIDIAKGAGKILLGYHGKKVEIRNKNPDGYDPVSTADLEANEFICNGLKKYGYQILSEELEEKDLDLSKPTWIVDPLDGTIGFLNKSKDFCTMIGLMIDKKIVFGVVYSPMHDKIYYAERGKGAFLIHNGEKKQAHVSSTEKLSNSSRGVRPFRKPNFLDVILDGKLKCKVKILGSIGVRLCAVAEGDIDFYVNNSTAPSKWDTAAPTIILEEAGGKITDFDNDVLDYAKEGLRWDKSFIASNSKLHDQILKEIPKNALEMMNIR
jgi:3'(2'), 5'-bisphosphate nucleotidase